jgi:tetratricopeptide (TPR) repeat protein
VLLLIGGTILAYHGAWNGEFIWDDDDYVTKNPLLTAPDGLTKIWFSLEAPSQYFPLTYTVFRLERSLWGLNPAGYHWVNVLLHALNALLVWRLLNRLKIGGAFLAALLFALHPVQVESVAWITELKNVLMGCFFLLSLIGWVEFVGAEARTRWRWYILALAAFALALAAKTTACTLPAALLLVLWVQKKRIGVARLLQVAPFVGLGLAMGLVTVWWERFHQGTRGALFTLGPLERLLVASHAVWFYLTKLFWPVDLTFIYPQWRVSAADPHAYIWLFVSAVLFGAVLWTRKRIGRGPEVAAVFFVATLFPVLGFIMLYTFRYTYVADHYQYLACLGPFALIGALFARTQNQLTSRPARWGLTGLAGAIMVILMLATWRQANTYRDVETLWKTTLARNPDCWMASNNLGVVLSHQGRLEEAIALFETSLKPHPEKKAQLYTAEAHYNLANTLLEKGDVTRALSESRSAVTLEPNNSDAHVAFGNALLASGDLPASLDEYLRAAHLNPQNADALYNLGNALQQNGDVGAAIDNYTKALAIDPGISEAHLNLGNILFQRGDEQEAIRHYEQALRAAPASAKAESNLAWALTVAIDPASRNPPRSLDLALRAAQSLHEDDALVQYTLAAAYAANGRFDDAVGAADKGLASAGRTGTEPIAAELRRVRDLYARHLAYRKPD